MFHKPDEIFKRRREALQGTKPQVEHAHEQHEQQEEALSHEITRELSSEVEQATEETFLASDEKNPALDFLGFQEAVFAGDFKLHPKILEKHKTYFKLLNDKEYDARKHSWHEQTFKNELEIIWNNWLGHVPSNKMRDEKPYFCDRRDKKEIVNEFPDVTSRGNKNLPINRIRKTAIQKLFDHYDQTQWGVDFDHPAQGFVVQGEPKGPNSILTYVPEAPVPSRQIRVEVSFDKKECEVKIDLKGRALEWWNSLYKIHMKHNREDKNTAELYRAFLAFINYIEQHKNPRLTLPKPVFWDDVEFSHIRSLPLTLGRIVSLLENCPDEMKQHQLNEVPFLDLSSTGAIRAIRQLPHKTQHYDYKPCKFVLRDMNCRETAFGKYHGYLTTQNLQIGGFFPNNYTHDRIINIYLATIEYHRTTWHHEEEDHTLEALAVAKETFWRYLAHHESLPLNFYLGDGKDKKGAVARIDEFKDPEIQAYLYSLLAGLSTDKVLLLAGSNLDMSLYWDNLCNLIAQMAKINKEHTIEFFDLLRSLKVLPPLDLLNKIIVLCTKWAHQLKINLCITSFQRLDQLLKKLIDPTIVYHGMRYHQKELKDSSTDPFLNPDDSLFLKYLDQYEAILEIDKKKKNHNAVSLLFQSMDTFNLNISDIKSCYEEIIKLPGGTDHAMFQKNCIDLIINMDVRNQERLSKEAFFVIVNKIGELSLAHGDKNEKTIAFIEFLEENYPNYFPKEPKNFLIDQKRHYQRFLTRDIQAALDDKFIKYPADHKKTIGELLQVYEAVPGEKILFIEVIYQLSELCKSYQWNLIDCLERVLFYELAQKSGNRSNIMDVIKLMMSITQAKNLSPLESVIYRANIEKIPQLIPKTLALYQNISPWLYLNQQKVSQQFSFEAMTDVLLAVPADELKNATTEEVEVDGISSTCEDLIKKLDSKLNSDKVTASSLLTDVDELLSNTVYCQDILLLKARHFLSEEVFELDSKKKGSGDEKTKSLDKKESTLKTDSALSYQERIADYANQVSSAHEMVSSDCKDYLTDFIDKKQTEKPRSIPFKTIKENLNQFIIKHNKKPRPFKFFILNYYQGVYQLIGNHPKIKTDLLKYISHFAKKYQSPSSSDKKTSTSYAEKLNLQLFYLNAAAKFFDAKSTAFRDMIYHGHHMNDPQQLVDYIKAIEDHVPEGKKEEFYKLLAKLIGEVIVTGPSGEKVPVLSLESFETICKKCNTDSKLQEIVFKWYQHPPYQRLEAIIQPYKFFGSDPKKTIDENYHLFDKKPFESDPRNRFNLAEAKKQAKRFSHYSIFTEEVLNTLARQIELYRNKTTTEKIQCLEAMKEKLDALTGPPSPVMIADLTALLTELIFSTANQEFNYTQVLALYSQLQYDKNAVHQISTGAGKSRIAMALCAGKWLLGYNPDFGTETTKLAEEAYHSTKAFFEACKIKTLLIDANIPVEDYFPKEEKGKDTRIIGFGERGQLGLFHGRIQSETSYPSKKNSLLVIDEADTTYLDPGKLHLNLSKMENDPGLDIRWAYRFIYDFTKEPFFKEHYLNRDNLGKVFEELRNYINKLPILPEMKKHFADFVEKHQVTLETLIHAALTVQSNEMKKGVHFDAEIAKDIVMLTDKGVRVASKALVKINNIVSHHSIYADAVQQFLHVRLNDEREAERKSPLGKKTSNTPYYIQLMSHIIHSSTAYTLLKQYQQFLGLTGSSGSPFDRSEVSERYNGVDFVDVPNHQPDARTELATHLVPNAVIKRQTLIKYHQETVREDRPHIMIVKNDNESQSLAENLKEKEGIVQCLDGSLEKYEEIVQHVGDPRTTTTGTNLLGRGVNTKLSPNANQTKGMAVTSCTLLDTCDTIQVFGRASRHNKPGTTRNVLDFQELKDEFSLSDSVEDEKVIDLFLQRDRFLKKLQLQKDDKARQERCVNTFINRFFDKLHAHYSKERRKFAGAYPCLENDWIFFIKKLKEKLWGEVDTINRLLVVKEIDPSKIIKAIKALFITAGTYYTESEFSKKYSSTFNFDDTDADYQILQNQLSWSSLELDLPVWQKTYSSFDEAHFGQNVVRHTLFAETWWTLKKIWDRELSVLDLFRSQHQKAATAGVGLFHPEWTAYWKNKRGLLANTRAFLRGNLNREWEAYEKAYIALQVYAKQCGDDKKAEKEAALAMVATVKQQATPTTGKEDLLRLTEVLRQTHAVMNGGGSLKDYEDLQRDIRTNTRWSKLGDIMKMVAGIVLLGSCIAFAVASHGFAIPIAVYGIKFSMHIIMCSAFSMLGTGTLLTPYGLFGYAHHHQNSALMPVMDQVKPLIAKA